VRIDSPHALRGLFLTVEKVDAVSPQLVLGRGLLPVLGNRLLIPVDRVVVLRRKGLSRLLLLLRLARWVINVAILSLRLQSLHFLHHLTVKHVVNLL